MSFVCYRIDATANTQPVQNRFIAATSENMREVGARTRREMRALLKYGRKTSRPGQPPTVHHRGAGGRRRRRTAPAAPQTQSPLREGILFGQPDPLSVIVGATRVGSGERSVARAIEEGGMTTRWDGQRIRIEARPFMGRAFGVVHRTATGLWADSI